MFQDSLCFSRIRIRRYYSLQNSIVVSIDQFHARLYLSSAAYVNHRFVYSRTSIDRHSPFLELVLGMENKDATKVLKYFYRTKARRTNTIQGLFV